MAFTHRYTPLKQFDAHNNRRKKDDAKARSPFLRCCFALGFLLLIYYANTPYNVTSSTTEGYRLVNKTTTTTATNSPAFETSNWNLEGDTSDAIRDESSIFAESTTISLASKATSNIATGHPTNTATTAKRKNTSNYIQKSTTKVASTSRKTPRSASPKTTAAQIVIAKSNTITQTIFEETTTKASAQITRAKSKNTTEIISDGKWSATSVAPLIMIASTSPPRKTTVLANTTVSYQWNASKLNEYYVYTPNCRMLRVDPFTPAARKIYKPLSSAHCGKDAPIISSSYNTTSRRYMLHMNTTLMKDYAKKYAGKDSKAAVTCCYQQVLRGSGEKVDKIIKKLPCANFHDGFVVPITIDSMLTECGIDIVDKKTHKKKRKSVDKDAFAFVQYRNITNGSSSAKLTKRRPSVLLIGIDSLSRFNMRRTMPKTTKHLVNHSNWYELEGYNKIDDNTFPNLMALLVGYQGSRGYAECKPRMFGGLDACPFIWQRYAAAGYRTAYAEDTATMSTFNYMKKGFNASPTDHYLRPLTLAVEQHLKIEKKAGLKFCLGRHQYAEFILDYSLEFAQSYRNESFFGLFWCNSFSHNRFDVPSSMDERILRYLKSLDNTGILEETIVLFFADHGMRFGQILDLPEGFLEERLPMFFISLPRWFRNAHPDFVRALQVNRNRLTTPYDVHMTLVHILQLTEPQLQLANYHAADCAACHSIFHEATTNRSCADVRIPEHWCTCVPYTTLAANAKVTHQLGTAIVSEINKFVASKDKAGRCSKLKLKKVVTTEQRVDTAGELAKTGYMPTYRIKFETTPKGASFQTTVQYMNSRLGPLNVQESISRLNRYAEVSKCVDDKQLKKYCICKS